MNTYERLVDRYINAPIAPPTGPELAEHLATALKEAVDGQKAPGPPPLLDVQGVADRLNVGVRTVETLIADGELVPVRVRSARRFTPESVDAYIRRAAGPKRRRRR